MNKEENDRASVERPVRPAPILPEWMGSGNDAYFFAGTDCQRLAILESLPRLLEEHGFTGGNICGLFQSIATTQPLLPPS